MLGSLDGGWSQARQQHLLAALADYESSEMNLLGGITSDLNITTHYTIAAFKTEITDLERLIRETGGTLID